MTTALPGGIPAPPVLSAPRFVVTCEGWTTGLGFSKLGSLQSEVEFQEYSYNSRVGNVHTKQFGRSKPPSIVLERALDSAGFAQLYGWHLLARMNNPLAKLPASFDILTKSGEPVLACLLENAWCQKLEVEQTQADASAVSMMKATIVCDGIVQL